MAEAMTERQLNDCLKGAQEAALLAAEQLESWRGRFSAREKGRADMVSEADLAAQQAIHTFLKKTFPGHGFLGEEDAHLDKRNLSLPLDAPPTWIVDPLDGTSNYVHDCPFYCVSIGLMVAGELVVGVIYDPRQKEMFAARSGGIALLNDKPIRVSNIPAMGQAMLSTGFPPDPDAQERNLAWWRTFSFKAQALRRTGSTALNLAYVACGRFDAYWAFDNYAWDVAAGIVLVREAGGVNTRVDGSKVDPFKMDLLAANPAVHAEMLACLRG